MSVKSELNAVYIIDGARTPFLKARGTRGPFSALDLATAAGKAVLLRQPFEPEKIDEIILGSVMPSAQEANIGRLLALRLGCGDQVPGWTVQRNCASGMQALHSAMKNIQLGLSNLVLAGGTEAMSRAPLLLQPELVNWIARFQMEKNIWKRMASLIQLRPKFFKPVVALMCGLTDPIVNLNMGQTAEILAADFGITREAMDEFALESHQKLAAAIDAHFLDEIVPIYDHSGKVYAQDDGLRRDSSLAALAKLKPFFDRKFGLVTAGNSSQITDGSAMLLLASREAVKQYQLPVLGKIVDVQWAALDPRRMGLGPVFASTPLLQKQKLSFEEIDYWEINEAFASQVLACFSAWKSDEFCRTHLGLTQSMGAPDPSRVNVDGGAIAMGHPVGASGARIVLHLLKVLERKNARRGVATICIGGGQGGAMLVERIHADEL